MKKYLFVLLTLLLHQIALAQENQVSDEEIDEIIDNIIAIDDDDLIDILEELNKYQVIFTSVDYNNKTYFLGRDLGIDQYNISPQITYENSIGIYAGISGTYYSEFDPKWDLTVLTAGYGKDFGKNDNFRAELGYSHYFFTDSDSNDFSNSIDAGFHVVTTNGVLGSMINASYLFGKKTGFQTSISVYGDFKLFDLNSNSGTKVKFAPDLSFFLGKENIDTSRINNLILDLPFVNRIIDSFETFSLRNTLLQLPIVFDFNNLNIEAGYNINFPRAFEFERNVNTTSYFSLGLSHMFELD